MLTSGTNTPKMRSKIWDSEPSRRHSLGTVWTYQEQGNESQRHLQAPHWYLRWFPNPKKVTKMMSRQSSFCIVKVRWPGWPQPSHMFKNRKHSSGIVLTYQKQANESQRHLQACHWYLRWFPNPKNVTKMMNRQSSFCMVEVEWPGWLQPSHMLKNRKHSSGIVWTHQKRANESQRHLQASHWYLRWSPCVLQVLSKRSNMSYPSCENHTLHQ